MFANGCNHTPPTESTPRRFYFPSEKFRWIKDTTASVRSPAKSFFPQCFESWQSFRSGTGGFQFFFSATNCWKLQIGSSSLWWAMGRVHASFCNKQIRRMQNNMRAMYFGQVYSTKCTKIQHLSTGRVTDWRGRSTHDFSLSINFLVYLSFILRIFWHVSLVSCKLYRRTMRGER